MDDQVVAAREDNVFGKGGRAQKGGGGDFVNNG